MEQDSSANKISPQVILIVIVGVLIVIGFLVFLGDKNSSVEVEVLDGQSSVRTEILETLDSREEVIGRINEAGEKPLSDEEKRAIIIQYGGEKARLLLNLSNEEKQLLLKALNAQ